MARATATLKPSVHRSTVSRVLGGQFPCGLASSWTRRTRRTWSFFQHHTFWFERGPTPGPTPGSTPGSTPRLGLGQLLGQQKILKNNEPDFTRSTLSQSNHIAACRLYLVSKGYPKILELRWAIPKLLEIWLSIPKILEIQTIPKILEFSINLFI